jgi:hypothetical protein
MMLIAAQEKFQAAIRRPNADAIACVGTRLLKIVISTGQAMLAPMPRTACVPTTKHRLGKSASRRPTGAGKTRKTSTLGKEPMRLSSARETPHAAPGSARRGVELWPKQGGRLFVSSAPAAQGNDDQRQQAERADHDANQERCAIARDIAKAGPEQEGRQQPADEGADRDRDILQREGKRRHFAPHLWREPRR